MGKAKLGATRAATMARIQKVDNQRQLAKDHPGLSVGLKGKVADDQPREVQEMQIALLEKEIHAHNTQLEDLEKEFAVNKQMYEERIGSYTKERDYEMQQADVKEAILHELFHPHPEPGPPPTGPRYLLWLEGNRMLVISSTVICFNLYTMLLEFSDPTTGAKFFWPDQIFMCFYVFELTLKMRLRERGFFIGAPALVWWNYLDFVIVVSGVFDMWITPLLGMQKSLPIDPKALRVLRLLRLARLARVLKAFLDADLSWTEHGPFQAFMMSVIGANAIIMGFEADFPDFWGWFYVEQILLVIFIFELSVRLKRWGFEFFYHAHDIAWNILDFTIVAGGVVDAYLLPLVDMVQVLMGHERGGKKTNIGQVMMMLRLARLLRILRLARLIKSIPPLYVLIQGIAKAMQGMVWVIVLTALLLYICALLGVKLIGHGLVFGGNAPDDMAAVFPNVLESMYVLFNLMNGNTSVIRPLLQLPIMKLVIIMYTILSTWAILSILTAVVSGNMIRAQDEHEKEVVEHTKDAKHERSVKLLKHLFEKADQEHDKNLTHSEFMSIVEDSLSSAMLMDASGLNLEDLQELFDCLATNPDGGDRFVSQENFIEGLQQERLGQVSERSVMRLEKHLSRMAHNMRAVQADVCDQK